MSRHDARKLASVWRRWILEDDRETSAPNADAALGDDAAHLRALGLLVSDREARVKARALEHLGDMFDVSGDRFAALASWKAAAREACSEGEAQRVYERVLDIQPDDADAAEALVHLYARAGAWERIAEVLGVIVRLSADRAGELLLELEPAARDAGALDTFVAMVDEVVALRAPSSPVAHGLRRAQARALAADAVDSSRASECYRALLDAAGDDQDAREYDDFVESRRGTPDAHSERRWLCEWRVEHAETLEEKAAALAAWADAEEVHGDLEQVVRVRRQLVDLAPDPERATHALRLVDGLDALGRDEEALDVLAPLLSIVPPHKAAHEIARLMLADPRSGARAAEHLERFARQADEPTAARVLELLLAAREETFGMMSARRRWYRRALELASFAAPLQVLVQGALDLPDELGVWDAAERVARESGELGRVVRAYAEVITTAELGAPLVDALGRRMLAVESECPIDGKVLVAALESALSVLPCARWALDRIKLALAAEERWSSLFGVYDRAVDAARDESERAELLDEAAVTARDLADDADRAIGYYAALRGLKPADVGVAVALERLYAREGRKSDLVALLEDRVAREDHAPAMRHDLRRRVAALRIDLESYDAARAALEASIADGASVGDVVDLLERVAAHEGQHAAVELLAAHYRRLDLVDEVVRLAASALGLARSRVERVARLRELVSARVDAVAKQASDEGAFDAFARLPLAVVEGDAAGDAELARTAVLALLRHAVLAWRHASEGAAIPDAADAAWGALSILGALHLEAGDPRRAARVLEGGARLPFAPARRRTLLQQAAVLYADRVTDAGRAADLLREVFEEDCMDPVAAPVFDRYAALLESSGDRARLARLWERRARHESACDHEDPERFAWERAAELWENDGAIARALVAYERGAALGSERCYDALARLHVERSEHAEAAEALEWLHARAAGEVRFARAVSLADCYVALDRTAGARALLEELAAEDGAAAARDEVRSRLLTLYRRDAVWSKLVVALRSDAERDLARGDEAVAVERLVEAADIARAQLDDTEEASRLLERAAQIAPRDATVLPKLADVLEALGRTERVAEVLATHVAEHGASASRENALVRHRLATVLSSLGRAEEAFAALREAARMQPTDPGILHDLGRVALDAGDLDTAERSYRALFLTMRRATEPCSVEVSKEKVYLDLGSIAMRKGDLERAAHLLDAALDGALENGTSVAAVEAALRELGRHDLVQRAVEARVAGAGDVVERAVVACELAELWRDHLSGDADLEARVRTLAARIEGDLSTGAMSRADHETVWSALWAMRGSLRDDGGMLDMVRVRVAALSGESVRSTAWLLAAAPLCAKLREVELLEKAIEAIDIGPERAHLRVVLARVLLARGAEGDVDGAITELTNALDENVNDGEAEALLSEALEREGRFDELATMLERRFFGLGRDASGDLGAAWLVARALERADRAKDASLLYEYVLDHEPADTATISLLAERLAAVRSERVVEAYAAWLRGDPGAAVELAPRLLELAGDHGGEALEPALVAALELVVAALPEDRALRLRLVEAHRAAGAHDDALRLLDEAIARQPADTDLLLLRAQCREAAGSDDAAVGDLRAVADAEGSRRADAILELLTRILARRPSHDGALACVASLSSATRDWARAADAYARLVPSCEPRAELALAFAHACEHAGRPLDAREALERALAASPHHGELSRRLARICELSGDDKRLAELLVGRADAASDAKEKSKLLVRAATLLVWEVGDGAAALPLAERALTASPEDVDVALACARLYMALGKTQNVVAALEEVIKKNRGKRNPAVAAAYLELAKAHLAADDLAEAFDALKAAFTVDARSPGVAMLLGLVAIDLGDEKTAERALAAVATLAARDDDGWDDGANDGERLAALDHLVRLADARGDVVNARRWATKALAVDPAHAAAREILDRATARRSDDAGVTTLHAAGARARA